MINEVTCNRCGWVHFRVRREDAEAEVKRFNAYFDALPDKTKKDYYGGKKAGMKTYERCFFCGQTDGDFRPAIKGDCPIGCTLQPVVFEQSEKDSG